jgi:hypothetical protein
MSNESVFKILPGLPPYGQLPRSFPESFAKNGKEGYVVEFLPDTDNAWICNFAPGIGGLSGTHMHPNNKDILVFADGNCFIVNPYSGEIEKLMSAAFQMIELESPFRLLISNQDLEFTCIGMKGILWESSRISWDGFQNLTIQNDYLTGLSWDPSDSWLPFSLNLETGTHAGGSYCEVISNESEATRKSKKQSIIWITVVIAILLICSASFIFARRSGIELRLFDFNAYIKMGNLTIKYPPFVES